ncbi:hypothetical protein BU14_0184s0005 [Porphyra umbilicalis]|uniref:Probable ATP-dependent transporter ycf16 n=1 Tax=Porphyra umbilicalis TaxID=2786 RepID=A0A1X6P6U2_PORUM|nr:hypothetical protein BU14_0184s0005 [Porphyra umbilicalis]|eukprot:OSX76578.1 hypothetical protein BU14_0184s0005 [Porphyra umbilicalis]
MWAIIGGALTAVLAPTQPALVVAVSTTIAAVNSIRGVGRNRRFRGPPSSSKRPPAPVSPGARGDPITLTWSGVSCALDPPKARKARKQRGQAAPAPTSAVPKVILSGVSGTAAPGRLVALLGPSGSGKTTLLNALSGRVPATKGLRLTGRIEVNGVPISTACPPVAYVMQEDLFFAQLTVRETLEMAAALQLPASVTPAERAELVTGLINRLGLVKAARTRVGDAKTRGISGGERKRLNLACELISAPNLVAVDEGTTGIDSFQALKVVEALRDLAGDGHTVLASIHQPQSSIYALFDDLLLLAEGQVVYMGTTAGAHEYFEGLGHGCPPAYNPAEHWIDLVSIDYSSRATEALSRQRVAKLHRAWEAHAAAAGPLSSSAPPPPASAANAGPSPAGSATTETAVSVRSAASPLTKFRLLFARAWKQMSRDKKTLFARTMSSAMSALLFGSIYWKLGLTQADVGNRIGLLQVACINAAMSALVKTLNSFTRERAVVDRERARGSYGVTPYFASKMVAELPISTVFPLLFSAIVYPMAGLASGWRKVATFAGVITLESFTAAAIGLTMGALAPSTEAALAAGPASFVIFIVFGGQFVTRTPKALQWLPRISLIRHAFEALCVSELGGLALERKVPWDVATGEQALARMSFGTRTVRQLLGSQARILAFNYIATYALLKLRKPKFAAVEEPAVVTEVA